MINLARLFSFTRALEEQLSAARASISADRDQAEAHHLLELERLQQKHADELEFLREQLTGANRERQFLQDRLLQRNAMHPLFEPSPGEEAARAASHKTPPKIAMGPRRAVQERGKVQHEGLRAQIDIEVADFIKQEEAKKNATVANGS